MTKLLGIWFVLVLVWALLHVIGGLLDPPMADTHKNDPAALLLTFAAVCLPFALLGLVLGLVAVNFHYGTQNIETKSTKDRPRDPDLEGRLFNREGPEAQPADASMPILSKIFLLFGPPAIGTFVQIVAIAPVAGGWAIFVPIFVMEAAFLAAATAIVGGCLGLIVAAATKGGVIGGWLLGSILGYLVSSQLFEVAHKVPWFLFSFPAVYFVTALPVWLIAFARRGDSVGLTGPAK